MRLSLKIFSVGYRGIVRVPRLHATPDSCYDGDGRLNMSDAMHAVAGDGVQLSDKDNNAVLSIGMEMMRQIESSLGHLASSSSSHMDIELGNIKSVSDARMMRKVVKTERRTARLGKDYLVVRVDVRYVKSKGVVVTISMSNPNEMVGHAGILAWNTAVALAIIATHVMDSLPGGGIGMVVEEGEFCGGLLDKAIEAEQSIKELRRHEALVRKSAECERNVKGYCSPVDFSCELCKGGKCVVPPPPAKTWGV